MDITLYLKLEWVLPWVSEECLQRQCTMETINLDQKLCYRKLTGLVQKSRVRLQTEVNVIKYVCTLHSNYYKSKICGNDG